MGNLHIHKGNLAGIHSGHTDKGMNAADLSLGGHLVFLPEYKAAPPNSPHPEDCQETVSRVLMRLRLPVLSLRCRVASVPQ